MKGHECPFHIHETVRRPSVALGGATGAAFSTFRPMGHPGVRVYRPMTQMTNRPTDRGSSCNLVPCIWVPCTCVPGNWVPRYPVPRYPTIGKWAHGYRVSGNWVPRHLDQPGTEVPDNQCREVDCPLTQMTNSKIDPPLIDLKPTP